MSKYSNSSKENFLKSIPTESLDNSNCNITDRCKFNFSFLETSQEAGQDFKDWSKDDSLELVELCNKLKNYSRESLDYWRKTKIGSGKHRNSILVDYDGFPRLSDFHWPEHVPSQAIWGRFRLEKAKRLVGFTIPSEYSSKYSNNKKSNINLIIILFILYF